MASDPPGREGLSLLAVQGLPVIELPSYTIHYAKDMTLEWEPPIGSDELALALSWRFPCVEGLENKMRAAISEFIGNRERRIQSNNNSTSRGSESTKPESIFQPVPQSSQTSIPIIL